MEAWMVTAWDILKNGGALFVCGVALYIIYKGGFVTKAHLDDVVKVKDQQIAALESQRTQDRRDFEDNLRREREDSYRWEQIAGHTTGWGRALAERMPGQLVSSQKQLPPDEQR